MGFNSDNVYDFSGPLLVSNMLKRKKYNEDNWRQYSSSKDYLRDEL